MKITSKLWIGIILLAIFSPLGIILPRYFKAGGAWGEDKILTLWKAPLVDYSFGRGEGLFWLSFSYIVSAVLGIGIIVGVVLLIGRKLTKKGN
jgi:hypothetical protein